MEILNSIFEIKLWGTAFILSSICLTYLIANSKLSRSNGVNIKKGRLKNFWFFIFSLFLGGSLIGLGISLVIQPIIFLHFIGGFITVFGAQLIVNISSDGV